MVAAQINDYGFDNKNLTLRNAYDVFILSKKTIAKNAFSVFYELENPLTCFLASCYEVFNKPETLQYFESKKIAQYLVGFNKNLCDRELAKKIAKKTRNKVFIYSRLNIIYKCFFYKAYRVWFLKTITDKNWRHKKMIQLGLKKSKSKF